MVPPARTPLRPDRLRALNLPLRVDVAIDAWGRPTWVRESTGTADESGREAEVDGKAEDPFHPCPSPPGEEVGGTGAAPGRAGKAVEDVVDEWRIDDEWWRTPIHRRYVEVVLEGGAHVVLFEDVVTGEWYVQKP
jgi:hypothetical protein